MHGVFGPSRGLTKFKLKLRVRDGHSVFRTFLSLLRTERRLEFQLAKARLSFKESHSLWQSDVPLHVLHVQKNRHVFLFVFFANEGNFTLHSAIAAFNEIHNTPNLQ